MHTFIVTNWNALLILHEIEFALRASLAMHSQDLVKDGYDVFCVEMQNAVFQLLQTTALSRNGLKVPTGGSCLKHLYSILLFFFWFELRSYNVYCVCVPVTTWLWSLSAVVVCFTSRDYFLWHLPVSTCVAVVMFTLLTSHSDLSLISKWYVVRSLLTFDDSEFLKTAKFYFSFQDVALIGGGFNGPVRTCCTE